MGNFTDDEKESFLKVRNQTKLTVHAPLLLSHTNCLTYTPMLSVAMLPLQFLQLLVKLAEDSETVRVTKEPRRTR